MGGSAVCGAARWRIKLIAQRRPGAGAWGDARLALPRWGRLRHAPGRLRREPAQRVMAIAAVQGPLRSERLAVQRIALDVADDLAIQADLVQVARAVVEPAQALAAGQLSLNAVAQGVVLVPEGAGQALAGACFLQQPAQQVVGQGGLAALAVGSFDQPPGSVPAVAGEFVLGGEVGRPRAST